MAAEAERETRTRLEPGTALGQAGLYRVLGEKVLGVQQLRENKSGVREDNRSGSVFLPFRFYRDPGCTAEMECAGAGL